MPLASLGSSEKMEEGDKYKKPFKSLLNLSIKTSSVLVLCELTSPKRAWKAMLRQEHVGLGSQEKHMDGLVTNTTRCRQNPCIWSSNHICTV